MPTIQELEKALINADRAGDVDAAKAIAADMRNMIEQPQQPTPQPEKPSETPFYQKTVIPKEAYQYAAETISNVPESAAKFTKGVVEAVSHPVETGKSLLDLAAGGLKAITPEPLAKLVESANWNPEATKRAEKVASLVGGEYKKRYGSLEDLKNTVKKDPVAVAADISILAGLAGKVASVSGMTRTAGALSRTAELTNPLAPVVGTAKLGGKVLGGAGKFITSKTTGAGAEAISRAKIGSEAFKGAMRGTTTGEEVVSKARGALEQVRENRAAAYTTELEKISKSTKEIPVEPIKLLADKWLIDKYNVIKTPDGLDFSRSTLSGTAAKEVQDVYNLIQDWGTRAGDNTPKMLDVLKRKLDHFYTESNNSRAMVTSLKNYVKDKIISEVPEYKKMITEYEKSSNLISEMDRALSLGKRASADTALRKIMTAIREDSNYRRNLIKALDETGDTGLMDSISGLMLNSPYSQRLGSLMAIMGVGGASLVLTNPKMLMLLGLASPRIVGEFTYLAGKIGKQTGKIKPAIKAAPAISTLGQVQGGLNGR